MLSEIDRKERIAKPTILIILGYKKVLVNLYFF